MSKIYYLEKEPQRWSGVRHLHVAGCPLMPGSSEVTAIGTYERAMHAMTCARKIHRKALSCVCCKKIASSQATKQTVGA